MEYKKNMNKGQLRQAYTIFYVQDAKQIIEDFENNIDNVKVRAGGFSKEYSKYTQCMLVLFIIAFLSFIVGLWFIGMPCIILLLCMAIFMPKNLKKEADEFNKQSETYKTEQIKNEVFNNSRYGDYEYYLKDKLMNKFLSIFGDFKWNKGHSFFNINDLIILPDMLSFDTDDCIAGRYMNTNIRLTEVYFGAKAFSETLFRHIKKVKYLSTLLPIMFIIFFVTGISPVEEKIKTTLFIIYIIAFIATWCMGFFSPIIMLFKYLSNKNNRGLIVEIDMPKNFEGTTVIYEKAKTNKTVDKKALTKGFSKTEFEDIEFNKLYSTYTTNQVEARYVLTTSVIERLKNIKFKFSANYLRFIFKNNKITIFISSSSDLFQMAKRNKKTDLTVFNNMFEEIYSVLSLIEELKLNSKTGL